MKEVIENITCDLCKNKMERGQSFSFSKTIAYSLGDPVVARLDFSITWPNGFVGDICDDCSKIHIKGLVHHM